MDRRWNHIQKRKWREGWWLKVETARRVLSWNEKGTDGSIDKLNLMHRNVKLYSEERLYRVNGTIL